LDRLSDIEQKRLRDIFHTSTHIQLIASSSKALEHTYKHDKPFFEFFKIIKLDGLNKKETHTLLEQLTQTSPENIKNIIKTQPNRIETIRRLTGGIPRTIILLFEIFLDDSANVFEDLEMILDRVTPLYKHRMDDLPTQQQAIMDTIALNWDGISSKEIVNGLKKRGFDSKKVSTQLILLEKNGLTLSKKIDKKNKIYFIKERFFNIWYLMRYGRKKNKSQVLWLVKFLQEWCDGNEIINRAKSHIQSAKENRLHARGGVYMAEALAAIVPDTQLQHELLSETKKALIKTNPNIDKKLSKSDIELFSLAINSITEKKYNIAIKNYKILIDKGYSYAMYNLANLYTNELNDFDKGIKYYQMAIEKEHSGAMHNLALIYQFELNDCNKAIEYYQMGIKNEDAEAMFSLAYLYSEELKDFDKAIKYYQMAIEKEHSGAMYNLALLYHHELNDFDKAMKYYQMAIKKERSEAMNNLANIYHSELNDFDKAIKFYQMAIEKEDSNAMVNLANLYQNELKDFDKAIKYYQMAIAKEQPNAMHVLAWLYYQQNTNKKIK